MGPKSLAHLQNFIHERQNRELTSRRATPARMHPRVAQAFAHIHTSTSESMVTSMDSYSLHLRGHPSLTRGHQKGMALALHDDQAVGVGPNSDLYSIQVILTVIRKSDVCGVQAIYPASKLRKSSLSPQPTTCDVCTLGRLQLSERDGR